MKVGFEKYLFQIDQAFENKKPNEVNMMYVVVAAGLFGLSYTLFWESSEQELAEASQKRIEVSEKLSADQNYLAMNPESKVTQLINEINTLKQKTLDKREQNEYITYKISHIAELYYDEEAWGRYLDSITRNAKKNNIIIDLISNERASDEAKFGHVLDIGIQANGNFLDMIRFIDAMELSDLVIDLHDLNLTAAGNLKVEINSSVWGITH